MEVYVRDKELSIIGIIDAFLSLIWTERYNSCGDFELYLYAKNENIAMLKEDYYLTRTDTESIMLIEEVNVITDVEEGNYLIVKGRSAEVLLNRRIVWQQTNLSGKVEKCIRQLILENAINPEDGNRKIQNLFMGEMQNFAETIDKQVTGTNLLTEIMDICASCNYGFKITLNDYNNFVFNIYKGIDRSYDQTENSFVVFSNEYDNLNASNYKYNKTEYSNIALVAGEGEGTERKRYTVGNASGMERYECFVDARDISTNNGEIEIDDYNYMLQQRGIEALKNECIIENFEGEADTTTTYTYRRDFYLGDIVQVENEYGMIAAPRITEVIESQDENDYKVLPTFSSNLQEV